ncbi:MAG: amidohydrolase family protein [Candidatus Bathyarchaeota archaeon]|jgi:N-acyl-D-aspartate/D-glutamate deacylase
MAEELDILIKNANIVDGTGGSAYNGALSVKGELISALGKVEGEIKADAKTIIDAEGLVVCPGFIDVHNHGDLSILYYPEAPGFVRQGITTFIGGQCGDSPGPFGDMIGLPWVLTDLWTDIAPRMYYKDCLLPRDEVNARHKELYGWEIDWHTLGEFFKRVEKGGISANYVPLVGHGDIRSLVMGADFKREATEQEVQEMGEHVERAMQDGCRGISVGRDYDPGIWAGFEELFACAKVAAGYGGVYASHSLRTGHRKARRPGEFPPVKTEGVLEAIDIGRKAGIPVQVSHLGSLYDVTPGDNDLMKEAAVRATLKLVDDAREEEIDVNFDLIPHHSTGGIYTSPWLAGTLAPWLKISGSLEQFAEALKMKDFREEIKEAIWAGKWYRLNPNITPNWAGMREIVESEAEDCVGKTVAEVAEERGVEPLDALMEILSEDPSTKAVRDRGDDWVKLRFMQHPEGMVGIDTFAVDDKWESRHPPWYLPNENSYGGFPRYLRRAYRETGALSLEEAIRKVTSLPAQKFSLQGRGTLKKGGYADIVVLDPRKVTDKGDQLNPRRYPEGIEHVIVNGILVVKDAQHTGVRPGKVLRREQTE